MKFFSKPGGEPPRFPSPEKINGGASSGDNVVVDAGTLDVGEPPAVPVDFVKAKIETRQEWVRAILAVLFVVLLSIIVTWAFIKANSWQDTLDLLDRVLPAVTGLLGSVMGFYFATRPGRELN